jgi:hypothetical protein
VRAGSHVSPLMSRTRPIPEFEAAPADRPRERLDHVAAGPPTPLQETLERLAELPDGTVLVQFNDRTPQHLYPKLDDRGYSFETAETDDAVVTAIWR